MTKKKTLELEKKIDKLYNTTAMSVVHQDSYVIFIGHLFTYYNYLHIM